jgi:MOSC domain-containing protein YiiM
VGGADKGQILSVNVGVPREVPWNGKTIKTGIFKEPVAGRVPLRRHNLDGDQQADLSVHGGESKAVYAYPGEHYEFWRGEFPGRTLPWGMFGENLTTLGLLEDAVHIGDRFRVGSAVLMVTQPRLPCFKLGIKFGREDIIKRFLDSGRSGFYFAVVQEGEIGAGDGVAVVSRDPRAVTVADAVRQHVTHTPDPELLARAIAVEALPEGWRKRFRKKLETLPRSVEKFE